MPDDRAVDVLVQGDEAGPLPWRRLLAVGAAVAVVAAAGGVLELRERRAAERALGPASAVDLAVVDSALGSTALAGRTATLQLVLQVRNAGGRPVTVLRGGVGAYGVVRPVELAAGQTVAVRLDRQVECGSLPPPRDPAADALELSVRTAAGVRPARVPLPARLDPDRPGRACGLLPREQEVVVEVTHSAPVPDGVLLTVEVATSAAERVDLLGARVDDGLDVALRSTDGTPVRLPLTLPVPSAGSTASLLLEAVLSVRDCTAAGGVQLPVLRFALADDGGRVVGVSTGYDPSVLRSLVALSC